MANVKVMLVNGSPRKNMNTAKLLAEAARGAQDAGAETETAHLYDPSFTGCKGCMACKMKNTKFRARCALKDDLTLMLEQCAAADVVVMGSPIYFSYPTGEFRSFLERFLFPVDTYLLEEAGNWESKRIKLFEGVEPCDIIYTMNCPEGLADQVGYPQLMEPNRAETERLYGHCEDLWCYDTYQVKDYALRHQHAQRRGEAHAARRAVPEGHAGRLRDGRAPRRHCVKHGQARKPLTLAEWLAKQDFSNSKEDAYTG